MYGMAAFSPYYSPAHGQKHHTIEHYKVQYLPLSRLSYLSKKSRAQCSAFPVPHN